MRPFRELLPFYQKPTENGDIGVSVGKSFGGEFRCTESRRVAVLIGSRQIAPETIVFRASRPGAPFISPRIARPRQRRCVRASR